MIDALTKKPPAEEKMLQQAAFFRGFIKDHPTQTVHSDVSLIHQMFPEGNEVLF